MANGISLGHLQIDPTDVKGVVWKYSVDGSPIISPEGASGKWDYYSTVEVFCDFDLSLENVRSTLGVSTLTRLGLVIVARSSAMARTLASEPVEATNGWQQVSLEIEPGNVGGKVAVELLLVVLGSDEKGESQFSPTTAGQVVFRASEEFLLEGTGAQLPILPVSFKEQGFVNSKAANWWLRMNTDDLWTSSNAALWLWINTDNEGLTPMLKDPGSKEGEIWLRFLSLDFARQVLQFALSHEALDTSEQYPEGSLGHTLQSVVLLLGASVEAVQARYHDDPSRIEAELQAMIGSAID